MHGSVLDEDEYMVQPADAGQAFRYLENLARVLRTHASPRRLRMGTQPRPCDLRPCTRADRRIPRNRSDNAYLINPGSVGQPRDGDPRTAYVLYNPEDKFLIYRRVPYDITTAQEKIYNAELPDILAHRLAVGR